jgi:hypothetical protein
MLSEDPQRTGEERRRKRGFDHQETIPKDTDEVKPQHLECDSL